MKKNVFITILIVALLLTACTFNSTNDIYTTVETTIQETVDDTYTTIETTTTEYEETEHSIEAELTEPSIETEPTEPSTDVITEHTVHKYTSKVVEPTCTQEGYTIYTCECGKTYRSNVTDKIAHDYETEIKESTCKERGSEVKTCKVCKYSEVKFIDLIGHDCDKVVTRPTCTEGGYTTLTCKVCGEVIIINRTVPRGHVFMSWRVTVKPTCVDAGEETRVCHCGEIETKTIEPIGHNYVTTTFEATTGWGGYDYHECVNCGDFYKDNETAQLPSSAFPKGYRDDTCTIIIYKEQHYNNWCYIAHLQFTDYTRFGVACANGSYNNGYETTSHATKRLGAIFAVNGDYTTPEMGNDVVRSGVVYEDTKLHSAAIYNANTGMFTAPGDLAYQYCSTLVANGQLTDTLSFFRWTLVSEGQVVNEDTSSRAQRTSIGTTGKAGEIYIVVSEGRYADGKSAGLTFNQCAMLMQELGCVFAIPLDGGGSSTMVWNGEVLNSAKNNERAVVDFVYFK